MYGLTGVFRNMWTAKAQISRRIHSVWSEPSLSTNRIIGCYRMYEWRAKAWTIHCTAKAQISLYILTVWSGPSLSANRIIEYYEWRAKAKMILCACAGWSESADFAQVRRHCFDWHGLYVKEVSTKWQTVPSDLGQHCFLRHNCWNI